MKITDLKDFKYDMQRVNRLVYSCKAMVQLMWKIDDIYANAITFLVKQPSNSVFNIISDTQLAYRTLVIYPKKSIFKDAGDKKAYLVIRINTIMDLKERKFNFSYDFLDNGKDSEIHKKVEELSALPLQPLSIHLDLKEIKNLIACVLNISKEGK